MGGIFDAAGTGVGDIVVAGPAAPAVSSSVDGCDVISGSGGVAVMAASLSAAPGSAACVLNTTNCSHRRSICCCRLLNLRREVHCREINATSSPISKLSSVPKIDAVRKIAMMVAMRGMKDISGFNIAALRDNTGMR